MNKEVHYEGWLIKSPPTKRIWRARWRRRWFTLKQGEIPEQFCLEYYTDRNCRKLKGVIDLDQCEQVDCGLRLVNRKQKFQYMFDIKTPKRTYYLAADTETDMRDWVNCICQVCHLLDTKQSNELMPDSNRLQNQALSIPLGSATISQSNSMSVGTYLSGTSATFGNAAAIATATSTSTAMPTTAATAASSTSSRQSVCSADIPLLREQVVMHQPQSTNNKNNNNINNNNNNSVNNADCPYVNTEYGNRETLICDMRLDQTEMSGAAISSPTSPGAAIYLNSPQFGAKQQQQHRNDLAFRLAINSNGIVRRIPKNLVLDNVSLPEVQQQPQQQQQNPQQKQNTHSQIQQQQFQLQQIPQEQNSVQPSPAPSTASGPYIPISECYSGSPKFSIDSNNPTTPLNNLDPKFYDTPRSHNNIGLNLTNDQSYSPKITNCSSQQISGTATNKNRIHRSDSDSESVFTDDEWEHPLLLRENIDRATRPSDSSVENESFVLTYSQRFSKIPDNAAKDHAQSQTPITTSAAAAALKSTSSSTPTTTTTATTPTLTTSSKKPFENLTKILKNKNQLMLVFKEQERISRDLPQFSDTENTSPAIGPRDASSVVDESYDIPRSHNLPYFNMGQIFEKVASPETNPIAASTPNLVASNNATEVIVSSSPAHVRTLPRPHYYTNAAPTKIEGNVFRYDFVEQGDLPPVNRKLKPKANLEDKPPDEMPAKPPIVANSNTTASAIYDNLAGKLTTCAKIQSPVAAAASANIAAFDTDAPKPPSVDRKLKPNAYKTGQSSTSATTPLLRRSTGAPLSMVLPNDNDNFIMETRTLPRPLRYNHNNHTNECIVEHQKRFGGGLQNLNPQIPMEQLEPPPKNEHKLQYFDLDVNNPPQINRQSMSIGNLNATGGGGGIGSAGGVGIGGNRTVLALDPSARAPAKSTVVYNFVDFVKTEAFKRIREERKKKSEGNNGGTINSGGSGNGGSNASAGNNISTNK